MSNENNKTNNGWTFKIQSGTDVYIDGTLFGTIYNYGSVMVNQDGRKFIPLNVMSPYNRTKWMFGFFPPDIIRDQEGKIYRLR